MTTLPAHLESLILSRRLLPPGEPLLVAVSGGLDSMVLLHLLHRLAKTHNWALTVAHLNHRLRGRASTLDEQLVIKTARKIALRCITEKADVKSYARKSGLSLEMAARKLRHEFLARTAREQGLTRVVLAHHADDQAELFFLRLLRGAGPEGLSGMKWSNPSPADSDIQLVRPLLGISREELARFAKDEKIPFREDATNASLDIFRNRIRHELLPLLERRYQPAVRKITLRLMEILAAESEMLADTAQAWLRKKENSRPALSSLPVALQRRILQAELIRLGLTVEFDLVEWLRLHPGKAVSVQPHLRLLLGSDGKLHLLSPEQQTFSSTEELALDLQTGQGTVTFKNLTLRWEIVPASKAKASPPKKRAHTEIFDADKVGPLILLRHWRPGDRFRPIGMTGTIKLQDWFSNLKIPRTQRHQFLVATTASGEIFWVENQRISETAKIDSSTRRCLRWSWSKTNEPPPSH